MVGGEICHRQAGWGSQRERERQTGWRVIPTELLSRRFHYNGGKENISMADTSKTQLNSNQNDLD